MVNCPICDSPDRAEIETALLSIGDSELQNLDEIAKVYELDIDDLQRHALFHSPIAVTVTGDVVDETPSIARQLKLREADMLAATAAEYMITLKLTGRCIRNMAQQDEYSFARKLTKPLVDLYIGTGGEMRATLKTLAELKAQIEGPKTDNNSGIAKLFDALGKAVQDKLPPGDD